MLYGENATLAASTNKPPSLADHLSGIRGEVGELTGRLSAIADRLVGGRPSEVEKEGGATPHHMAAVEDIRRQLARLRDQVNRLDNVL